ncbi:uncharacterized protein LOC123315684 [Coccinella septempunctata]|uniref:uncharacterized protein LOC123315684 n=1 Tax=Coccinella septempunctata TaxID=41139 RepID=UPI001D06EDB5|nr:uncharacterized protein LOC123315684 [Coccinella septempunctata]
MKWFLSFAVLLLSVCCVFSLKIDLQHASTPHQDCAHHHHHFPQEKLDKLNKGEPVDPKDEEIASHLVCILKERKYLSEDGTINKDLGKARITKVLGEGSEDIDKVMNCLVQHTDQKETAVTFYNCVAPLIKKHNSQ